MKQFGASLLAFFLMAAAGAQPARHYSLVITHARIVDVEQGRVLPDRLLAISGNTIAAIDASGNQKNYKADRYLDVKGRYVIPGLWDMHVHFRGGDTMIAANKKLLNLFMAYGVTAVRDCGGDITPAVMQWRTSIAAGTMAGPKIFTSGPKLDGTNPTWPGSLVVDTKEQVVRAIDSLQKIHVDFVKLYDSRITRFGYLESISEAERRGMKTSGHMPFTVELTEAVERGLDASEHLFYVFKACSSKEDSITKVIQDSEHSPRPVGLFQALPALYASFSQQKADKLFHWLAQKHFTVVPTLYISKVITELRDNDHAHDSLLHFIDPKIVATYRGRVAGAKRESEQTAAFMKDFEAKCASLVPQMQAAGVNILAGSDCGAYNSYDYPGQSLHEELKMLVAYRLTPAQALRAATINGARFMGVNGFYGSIARGKSSDLLVLDGDPLQDISAVDSIRWMLVGGKLYSRQEMDALLQAVRNQ